MRDDQNERTASIRSALADRSIVLVGLMGAGKSAIGRQLAALLELPFHDADNEIEQAAQRSIAEIFEEFGEPEFRRLEQRVIERLLAGPQIVLATGGGAWMNAETREATSRHAVSLWLSADLETLMERVGRKSHRPLLQNDNPRAVMQRLMAQRNPFYSKADVEVRSENLSKEMMTQRVVEALHAHLAAPGNQAERGSQDHAQH